MYTSIDETLRNNRYCSSQRAASLHAAPADALRCGSDMDLPLKPSGVARDSITVSLLRLQQQPRFVTNQTKLRWSFPNVAPANNELRSDDRRIFTITYKHFNSSSIC